MNIVLVKGFYINIVLELKVYNLGIWFYSLDCLLRIEIIEESIIIRQIVYKARVLILEFKPVSSFYISSYLVPSSLIEITIFLILKKKLRQRFCKSRNYTKPCLDLKKVWYI